MLQILIGDALTKLRELPAESVQCCVTSPPFWGLRDYGTATWHGGDGDCDHVAPPSGGRGSSGMNSGESHERWIAKLDGCNQFKNICGKCGAKRIDAQLGLEKTPEEYVAKMVEIFREVRRILRNDGTLWLNLGDSYAANWNSGRAEGGGGFKENERWRNKYPPPGLKSKDLVGIPWMVAFALRADGWWLRCDIIWAKPNPMPESVTDRCTKSHEYIFLLTKSSRYFYDAEAIKENGNKPAGANGNFGNKDAAARCVNGLSGNMREGVEYLIDGNRNKRSVWTVTTQPYPEAHFATYPPDLIKPMILAGTSARGCCAKCGAPHERIVEQTGPSTYAKVKGDRSWREMSAIANEQGTTPSRPNSGQTRFENGTQPHLDAAPSKTIGWQPTCQCNAAIVPCTVIDPFGGSGTTGQVALELGRKAILIELNPKYADLIDQRCTTTIGLPF